MLEGLKEPQHIVFFFKGIYLKKKNFKVLKICFKFIKLSKRRTTNQSLAVCEKLMSNFGFGLSHRFTTCYQTLWVAQKRSRVQRVNILTISFNTPIVINYHNSWISNWYVFLFQIKHVSLILFLRVFINFHSYNY